MSRARSNKAKGRNGQQEVSKLIQKHFPELEPDDLRSNPMGSCGEDILLSPKARSILPWQIEVKRKKTIGAARFMEQASLHGKHEPVVFFREDYKDWLCLVKADYLLELLRRLNK